MAEPASDIDRLYVPFSFQQFYTGDKTMTLITDAKSLLKSCQQTEDSIYDLVAFCACHEDFATIHCCIGRVPKMMEECREMVHLLVANEPSSKTYVLRNNLRRMSLRLEAAILYSKNYFKLN
jgi:hypothetical protein